MANRYIELKAEDAKQIDGIINSIASHPHLDLSEIIKFHINNLEISIRNQHEKDAFNKDIEWDDDWDKEGAN